jgi:hypothetical protein
MDDFQRSQARDFLIFFSQKQILAVLGMTSAGALFSRRRSLVAAIVYGENPGGLVEDKGDGIRP